MYKHASPSFSIAPKITKTASTEKTNEEILDDSVTDTMNTFAPESLYFPADIFLSDILLPINGVMGGGWSEELIWDEKVGEFKNADDWFYSGDERYPNQKFEIQQPYWEIDKKYKNQQYAIAIFNDENKYRLFVNFSQQHTAIQPGLGLPIYAGILTTGEKNGKAHYTISNHSGHYKPSPNIDIDGIMRKLLPASAIDSITTTTIPGLDAENHVRLDFIRSPKEYSELVAQLSTEINVKEKLIEFLKNQGIYNDIIKTYPSSFLEPLLISSLAKKEEPKIPLLTQPSSPKSSRSSSSLSSVKKISSSKNYLANPTKPKIKKKKSFLNFLRLLNCFRRQEDN